MMLLILLLAQTPFLADKVEIIRQDNESIIRLVGNVVIEDEKTKITCSEANLNESRGSIVLIRDVKIVDKNGEIHANSAVYYMDGKKGYLSGDVSLLTERETISSDSLHYDGMNDFVEMFSNVMIEDPKNNLIAYSQSGWYDLGKDQGYLVGDPNIEILREDKEPIQITANEFHLITHNNTLYGFDSVVTIIDSITIYCDTFSYNLEAEKGNMVKPVILDKNNELKGETGQFKLANKNIESFSVENGRSEYYTEKGSKNVVEGSKISIIFMEGKASKILVEGQPKGILYLKSETGEEDVSD